MKTRHFAQLIGMSALWGASFPLIRIASPALGPFALAGIRCAPLTLGMLPGCGLILLAMAFISGFNPFRSVMR